MEFDKNNNTCNHLNKKKGETGCYIFDLSFQLKNMIIDTNTIDLMGIFQAFSPAVSFFMSAGGLALVMSYIKERREFHATTQGELIKELNRMINEERNRCATEINSLQARINILEAQVASI